MPRKKPAAKSPILKAVLLFLCVFIVSVILWIQVKDSYSYVITIAASKSLAWVKDVTLEGVTKKGDAFSVFLHVSKGGKEVSAVVTLSSSVSRYYSFTVPLTLSMLAGLSL